MTPKIPRPATVARAKLDRRGFLLAGGAGLVGAGAGFVLPCPAQALDYPTRTVEVIMAFPPGGSSDGSTRIITDSLSQMLNNRFVILHKPGAAGNIGTAFAARATPDGYTLAHGYLGNIGINPGLYGARLPYDPVKDFVAVASVCSLPMFLVVHPSVPVSSVPELVAYAKAKPGELTFASSGNGSSNQLVAEMFKTLAGIDMRHIPFSGSGTSNIALLGGHVNICFDAGHVVQHIKAGKLRGLAVTSGKRLAELPELPTMAEFYPGFEATSWHGLFAPTGTPKPIVELLNARVNEILARPETAQRLGLLFMYPMPMSSEAYGQFIRAEIAKWTAVIKAANVTIE